MIIQFYIDSAIDGRGKLGEFLADKMSRALSRYENMITEIEIHLGEGHQPGNKKTGKHCTLEVRADGMEPIAVDGHARTIEQAVNSSIIKLKVALEMRLSRLNPR